MKNLKCDCCGKDDLNTTVSSSTLGAVSYNYCETCLAMGAEPTGMEDLFGNYMIFDSDLDSYVFDNRIIPITLESGLSFMTRTEYIEFKNKVN